MIRMTLSSRVCVVCFFTSVHIASPRKHFFSISRICPGKTTPVLMLPAVWRPAWSHIFITSYSCEEHVTTSVFLLTRGPTPAMLYKDNKSGKSTDSTYSTLKFTWESFFLTINGTLDGLIINLDWTKHRSVSFFNVRSWKYRYLCENAGS